MIDFIDQTTITGENGSYRATIHPELSTPLGPYGAYVAGIGLRAAGAQSRFDRPASLVCHYLKPAQFGEVELVVEKLRAAKRAESLRVSMNQQDKKILELLVWTAAELPGYEHEMSRPVVPSPAEVRSWEELFVVENPPSFWKEGLETRPIIDDPPLKDPPWREEDIQPGPPQTQAWLRMKGQPLFEDPFVEAARLLLPIDWTVSNAAYRPHFGQTLWLPTMELTAAFHDLASDSHWMLADCESPIGRSGLMWGTAKIWSEEGSLLATGAQLMLQRHGL